MIPDSSLNSKSQSTAASITRKAQDMVDRSMKNASFHLYDQMTQFAFLPTTIYRLFLLIVFLQQLFTSMWIPHSNSFGNNKISFLFSQYFYAASCLCSPSGSDKALLITFATATSIFGLVFLTFIAQLISYYRNRRFFRWTLFTTRIFLELFPLIGVQVIGVNMAHDFLRLFKENCPSYVIAFFVIAVIEFIFFIYQFYVGNSMFGYSAFLPSSPLAAFDLSAYIKICMAGPIFCTISYILIWFPPWLLHPVIVLHIFLYVKFLIAFLRRPFINQNISNFFITICFSCILNDVIRLILLFFKSPSGLIPMIGLFVGIILGAIFSVVYTSIQTKKLKELLTYPEGMSYTEDAKSEWYSSIGVDANSQTALLYLDFGWKYHLKPILDTFYIKYVFSIQGGLDVLVHLIKITAYLPPNSRLLNILIIDVMKQRKLNMFHKFFLTQVQQVKLLRQSSSSQTALEKISDLKAVSRELEMKMRSFWERNDASFGLMYNLSSEMSRIRALWEEAIVTYPNSEQYSEEYARFLVECSTDFTYAIRQKNRAQMIESGHNFSVDKCFKQFVKNFPDYLKLKIVDLKGNIIQEMKKNGTSSTSGSNVNISTSSSSMSDLDIQIEEGIGRILISRSRIRLALQRATEHRKANRYGMMILSSVLHFVLAVAFLVFIFANFNNFFDSRNVNNDRIELNTKTRLYLYSSTVAMLYEFGTSNNLIDFTKDLFTESNSNSNENFFSSSKSWVEEAVFFNVHSRSVFKKLIQEIVALSGENVDISKYALPIFNASSELFFCKDSTPYDVSLTDLNSLLNYLFMSQILVSGTDQATNLWYSKQPMYCTLIKTLQFCWRRFNEIQSSLSVYDQDSSASAHKAIQIMMIAFPVVFIIFSLFTLLLCSNGIIKELNSFARRLLDLPSDARIEAAKPLKRDAEDEQNLTETVAKTSSVNIPSFFTGLIILIYIIIATIMLCQLLVLNKTNDRFTYMRKWTTNARIRKCLVVELCLWLDQAILSKNPILVTSHFTDVDTLLELASNNFKELETAARSLFHDDEELPSVSGLDEMIDKFSIENTCVANQSDYSFHEMYRCASTQQLISVYLGLAKDMINGLDLYNGIIKEEKASQLLHIASGHLLPKLIEIDERFSYVAENEKSKHILYQRLFFSFGIIASFIGLMLNLVYIRTLDRTYKIILTLMRRVSPVAIVTDNDLMVYLLDKSKVVTSAEMSTDQSVIHNTKDSIFCLGITGIIETMNPAVTRLFGYTPEQLLGQSITSIICEAQQSSLLHQMDLMIHNQSAPTFEDHTECVTDDNTIIPCAITILAMSSGYATEVTSLVVILRDESLLLSQQKKAEEAKKQSETLLYQILPRNIVIRLNQGEKDISFTVNSSTIMFIDIVKFSEYAATLTPAEIMGNLSVIFAAFDESVSHFPLLLKIKLIGDVYMCAGGLFNPDDPPVSHAEQMVKFGLDALQILEETNMKLNAMLNVRIGVNTGGPLIAGVLGTDKPTFDIIGDPINIASRLQSTDIPGKIQISQNTYELINNLDFTIEPRGEVFLKGKGKTVAYLVSQTRTFILQTSTDVFNSQTTSVSTGDRFDSKETNEKPLNSSSKSIIFSDDKV